MILLVEDDAGDVLLVEELLADSGMQASLTTARSLAEATGLLSQGPAPGCILLDLHLPDVQGLEAVTQMLAAAPGAPVVVLTGLAEESAGLAAVAAGAQDYLIKGQAPPDVFGRAIRYATQR
ncbi:MAG: fused response regulator/phosphatase, partial [Pseudonocardiales bacterium]